MIIALAGHRPEHLFDHEPYSEQSQAKLLQFVQNEFKELKPTTIITGMAQGFDTAGAIAAISLQIPFVAAIPFSGQERIWPADAKEIYNEIVNHTLCEKYIVNPGSFAAWKMHTRNQWMVNNCDTVLALYDENKKTGGTKSCIEYAIKQNKKIVNIWDKWLKYEKN